MISKIKLVLAAALLGLAFVSAPATVNAQANITDCIKQGTTLNGGINDTCDTSNFEKAGNTDLTSVITTVVNVISIIVGVIAVIMIIFGGLKYITSGGDSGKITGAKNTIMYALIGLVIVALAQFIVRFVLTKASDIETTA